jgi:hypothetical protein
MCPAKNLFVKSFPALFVGTLARRPTPHHTQKGRHPPPRHQAAEPNELESALTMAKSKAATLLLQNYCTPPQQRLNRALLIQQYVDTGGSISCQNQLYEDMAAV